MTELETQVEHFKRLQKGIVHLMEKIEMQLDYDGSIPGPDAFYLKRRIEELKGLLG